MHLANLTNTQFFFLTFISLCVCYAVATAIALANDNRSADRDISSRFLEPAAPDSALKCRDDAGVVATVNFAQRQSQTPVSSTASRPSSSGAVLPNRIERYADDAPHDPDLTFYLRSSAAEVPLSPGI